MSVEQASGVVRSRRGSAGAGAAERPPAYQILADDLRAQITSGQLRPGDRLPTEPELCARSGVSRSTVREALRLLASQHLIVTTRGVTGGSFVCHPSPAQLADTLATGVRLLLTDRAAAAALIEVREIFEVPGAELAALRRTDEDLAALDATMFDPVSDSLDAMLTAQRAFHTSLAVATHNALYELFARPLYDLCSDREMGLRESPGFWAQVDADHREILRRVVAGDGPGAAAAARAHLALLKQAYADQEQIPPGQG
ncbi:MAG: FadR family transcriptional regulator [Micromonosporaceae bacterium]|jgi:DNA-binding FadR family transcriptional regulator|nr:FadR family transcriptional regulator [Micromonosporaceae bacterium]